MANSVNSRLTGPVSSLLAGPLTHLSTISGDHTGDNTWEDVAGARLSSPLPERPWECRRGAGAGRRETPRIEQRPVVNRAGSWVMRSNLPTRRLASLRSFDGASRSPPCQARRRQGRQAGKLWPKKMRRSPRDARRSRGQGVRTRWGGCRSPHTASQCAKLMVFTATVNGKGIHGTGCNYRRRSG